MCFFQCLSPEKECLLRKRLRERRGAEDMDMVELVHATSILMIWVLMVIQVTSTPTDCCQRQCGNVKIPYPFGIGEECPYSKEFQLICNRSFNPPRPYNVIDNVEIVDIDVLTAQVLISVNTTSYFCGDSFHSSQIWWLDLSNRRYTYSYSDNVFVTVGCNTTAVIRGSNGQIFGCTSDCNSDVILNDNSSTSCNGFNGCCQTPLQNWVKGYYPIEIQRKGYGGNNATKINNYTFSFLTMKNSYNIKVSDIVGMDVNRKFPLVLDWTISNETCEEPKSMNKYNACVSKHSYCVNSNDGLGYVCNCSKGYHGNPYVHDGCQDINECDDRHLYPCKNICVNTEGSYDCVCPKGTSGDPAKGFCEPLPKSRRESQLVLIIPVVIASTVLAIALIIRVYVLLQKRKLTKLKKMYFLQNGGSILQRQISSKEGTGQGFKIFTREEVEKATNNYDRSCIIGRGSQGVVYGGTLPNDSRTFAIKKSVVLDGSQIEQFVNEIIILSQINHRNVVQLLGCCLEVEDPLLIYEFVPNGTLFHHIHDDNNCLSWKIRLRVAAETAGALAYLHSSVSTPIIHRDVKSSNILLDINYAPKVSDFGASRLIPINEKEVTTMVKGTLGYLDPEYMQTHQLTDKSDVYSFGVVLVELLTGKMPFSFTRDEKEQTLAIHFIYHMKENRLHQLLDTRIANMYVMSQMDEVAEIARQCLSLTGEDRPSMAEVGAELEGLRRTLSQRWNSCKTNEEVESLLGEPSTHYYSAEELEQVVDVRSY